MFLITADMSPRTRPVEWDMPATIRVCTPEENRAALGNTLPRELYEAYIESSGGLSWDGKPCPTWENLTEAVRKHWGAAAIRAWSKLVGMAPDSGVVTN